MSNVHQGLGRVPRFVASQVSILGEFRLTKTVPLEDDGNVSPYQLSSYGKTLLPLICSRTRLICGLARVWAAIGEQYFSFIIQTLTTRYKARTRHINEWGLSHPRLDRLQDIHIHGQNQDNPSRILAFGEFLSFNTFRRTLSRLTTLWNRRVVYVRHWNVFGKEMREEWL